MCAVQGSSVSRAAPLLEGVAKLKLLPKLSLLSCTCHCYTQRHVGGPPRERRCPVGAYLQGAPARSPHATAPAGDAALPPQVAGPAFSDLSKAVESGGASIKVRVPGTRPTKHSLASLLPKTCLTEPAAPTAPGDPIGLQQLEGSGRVFVHRARLLQHQGAAECESGRVLEWPSVRVGGAWVWPGLAAAPRLRATPRAASSGRLPCAGT